MTFKQRISKSSFGTILRYLREFIPETKQWKPYAFDSGLDFNEKKQTTDLTIRVHALEKGMSIGNVKYGFGQDKTKRLLNDLRVFFQNGGDVLFFSEALTVVKKYIEFNNFNKETEVVKSFNKLLEESKVSLVDHGGILEIIGNKEKRAASFAEFSRSRFAIRDFSSVPLNVEDLKEALQICEKTPSACNRQPWRIHVYLDKQKRDKMFRFQGGSRGFSDDMQGCILVSGDMNSYSTDESNLLFVDGGLYAMNLMYALHYKNIASIPLSMGMRMNCIKKIKQEMGMPENELPVLLLGIGTYKDSFKVAASSRYYYNKYTIFE